MNASYTIEDLTFTPDKNGADQYIKISYPFRFGKFNEIKSKNYTFQCNLNGEIKTIQGRGEGWLDASEWLKRSAGNDWTYFAAGGYTGAYDFTGEYYVPCLPYDSNGIFGHNRFDSPEVKNAFSEWLRLMERLKSLDIQKAPEKTKGFIPQILAMDTKRLAQRGQQLHDIIGGRVSVLPPDTRHVEYDVIPLTIADGCLYNCGFCRVKSGKNFKKREKQNILDQLHELKRFYAKDIINYNAVFMGQHDALFAGMAYIEFAARKAYEILEFKKAFIKKPRLFFFASVDSLLRADASLFEMLDTLPFDSYINIGLESADPDTLAQIEKPLNREKVERAFRKMMAVNKTFSKVEISANFLYGAHLPKTHMPSIIELIRNQLDHFHSKGSLYFSPMENIGSIQEVKSKFMEFKMRCRLPAYMYLIQRL